METMNEIWRMMFSPTLCQPPPPTTPNCPTWTPPPNRPSWLPPHRPSLNPPSNPPPPPPGEPSAHFYWGGGGGGRTKARRRAKHQRQQHAAACRSARFWELLVGVLKHAAACRSEPKFSHGGLFFHNMSNL